MSRMLNAPAFLPASLVSALLCPATVFAAPPALPSYSVAAHHALPDSPVVDDRPLMATGSSTALGQPASCTLIVDAAGRFKWSITGRLAVARSWDGEHGWLQEFHDLPRPAHLGEREDAILLGQFLSGAWMSSGMLALTPNAQDPAQFDFHFKDGRSTGSLTTDPSTGRLTRAVWKVGADEGVLAVTQWIEVGQRAIPSAFSLTAAGSTTTVSLDHAEVLAESRIDASTFALLPDPDSSSSFAPDVPAQLEVKRAATGHLLVQPLVNGRNLGWFIFDSGAGITVLDQAAAADLSLETFGGVSARGSGGAVESPFVQPDTIALGALTLTKPIAITLDFSAIGAALGEHVAGVIGFDVLQRSIAEIDMSKARIALHDPARFDSSALHWSDMMLYGRRPHLNATYEGHPGVFTLDTGAGSIGVLLYAPAVQRGRLLEGRELTDSMTGGVGGFKAAKSGLLSTLDIAGLHLESVPTIFSLEAAGATTDEFVAGAVGGQVLGDRVLFLDYGRERLALVAPR